MSLNWGAYFQRGMGLKVRVWVDHLTEGDRHERHSTNDRGAAWAFLNGTLAVEFRPLDEDGKRYECIAGVLKRLRYRRLRRADKGVVLRYLERTTGYSRQQLTRRVLDGEKLAQRYRPPTHGFARKFSELDRALLAETDALHGNLSGPATQYLMRLATISVAHLYNLRQKAGYRDRRRHCTKTGGHSVPIAAPRLPTTARASSASTACTKATSMASRASTTSTPWDLSPSSRSWPPVSN